ncbi:MAG TPA: Gfo/Idh/MocA family oxidoreductase [Polyangiaceae bacterium]|nr:Gfo/Idh/MocA family oxidoreductase [Polyangiaceae bacterium]
MRALFVGLGGIGQRHLRNLRTLLGADVRVSAYRVRGERHVIDDKLSVEAGADVVEKYGVRVVLDLEGALAERPDVVFVTNPTRLHVDVALRAAKAGAHLFLEKPLSDSLEGVPELVRVVREKKLVAFVGYQLRRHPGFLHLRSLLSQRVLGNVLSVSSEVGEYLPAFHPYEDYRRMYASRKDLGGGVTLSQIHEIDYLYALFGAPERVFSLGGHLSSLEVDVDDVSSSLLECRRADGAVIPVRLYQDYVTRPSRRLCRVVGDGGSIEWNLTHGTLTWWGAEGTVMEERSYGDVPRNQLFLSELHHFLECIEKRRDPEVTVEDAAQSLSIALALVESQKTGRVVTVSQENSVVPS